MKKRLIILLFAFAVIAVFLANWPDHAQPWRPNTRLGFVGFTNLITQTNALFAITNLPTGGGVSWILREVSRRDGTNWKEWDDSSVAFGADFYWPDPADSNFLATVPVETIAEPSRIVIELKLHPTGPPRFFEDLRAQWAKFRGKDGESAWRGPSYFLTNETLPVGFNPQP